MSEFAVHAALATPFRADGALDLDALRAHVRLLRDDGVDGIVLAGTTGEGPLLEESEIGAAIATAVEAADGAIEVIAHVGRASTVATLRLARAAIGSGADALLAVTPYYFAHDDDALRRHYGTLLETARDTPVLAYTFPARAGNRLEPELLDALAGDGIAGVKDSTGTAEHLGDYLEVAGRHRGLRVFAGSERLALQAQEGGGAGTITAFANARADLLLALREARSEDAQREVDEAGRELSGVGAVKRAVSARLAELGVAYPPEPRAPLA